jgi:glycosyltransferase involved in cell wall biosynthesis
MTYASISVVIPVRNGEAHVAEAIGSVLTQTSKADQIIVVNDGSTDGTPRLLRSFGPAITCFDQGPLGVAAALNSGIAGCVGDLVGFLDADDVWLPEKLALQRLALDADPEIDAAFGMIEQFDATYGGTEITPGYSKITMLIRRPVLDRVGAFDITLSAIEFIDWYSRALDAGIRSHLLPDVVARRRVHSANMTRSTDNRDLLRAMHATLERRRLAPGKNHAADH